MGSSIPTNEQPIAALLRTTIGILPTTENEPAALVQADGRVVHLLIEDEDGAWLRVEELHEA